MWQKNNKYYLPLVFVILILAALLRLGYVLMLEEKVHWVDEQDYLTLAASMVDDMEYRLEDGTVTAFRPPGYPFLLAGLRALGVRGILEIRLFQVVLSVLTLVILFAIARRLGGRGAALISITIGALYPYFIFICGTLYATVWFSFLLLASVYLLIAGIQENNLLKIIASGCFMGGVVLTRTSALVLGVVALLWLIISTSANKRRSFIVAVLFSISMSIFIAPWVIRNMTVLGKATLSTNGGRNFWLGNNPQSTINSGSNIEMPLSLEERVSKVSETNADRVYIQEALTHIRENPGHYLWLSVKKGLCLWRLDPSPTTEGYSSLNRLYPFISILSYTPLIVLAIIGFVRAQKLQRQMMWLWVGFALGYTLLHAVFITKVRFRIPLDHFIIVMASIPVIQWWARIKHQPVTTQQ